MPISESRFKKTYSRLVEDGVEFPITAQQLSKYRNVGRQTVEEFIRVGLATPWPVVPPDIDQINRSIRWHESRIESRLRMSKIYRDRLKSWAKEIAVRKSKIAILQENLRRSSA